MKVLDTGTVKVQTNNSFPFHATIQKKNTHTLKCSDYKQRAGSGVSVAHAHTLPSSISVTCTAQ